MRSWHMGAPSRRALPGDTRLYLCWRMPGELAPVGEVELLDCPAEGHRGVTSEQVTIPRGAIVYYHGRELP